MHAEYRLSDLLQIVQHGMHELFGSFPFRCIAEISKYKEHKGRIYLDLMEVDETWNITAQAKAIVWQEQLVRDYCRVMWLWSADKLVGAKVCMQVTCSFHAQYGFSLNVSEFSQTYAQGAEAQQRARAKEKLQKIWIFGSNKQKSLGYPPLYMAIISSVTAAWVEDFLSILEASPYLIETEIFTATVHWNTAKEEVVAACDRIYAQMAEGKKFDLICLVRWWGGKEGFARTNDGELAEVVCRAPVPFLTAVWHTADQSLLDEVSRHAARTPSDAAHYITAYISWYEQNAEKRYRGTLQRLNLTARHLDERAHMRASAVADLLQQRISQYINQLDHRRWTILLADPREQRKKWYALVQSDHGDFLGKKGIESLKIGDKLRLSIYDNIVDVWVQGINKMDSMNSMDPAMTIDRKVLE